MTKMTDERFQQLQQDWFDAKGDQLCMVGYRLMDELIKARNENARLQEFINTRDMEIERLRAAMEGRLGDD